MYYFLLIFGLGVLSCRADPVVVRGQRIPLRDGITVVADVYVPDATGQYPTILELTPYGRSSFYSFFYEYSHWNENGFTFMMVDTRGQGDSEGQFQFFSSEGQDAYDIFQWIAQQPWSNGRIAMRGSSYTGTNQWYSARSGSPYLSCITPTSTGETFPALDNVAYRSGLHHFKWSLDWPTLLSDSGVNSSIRADYDALLSHRPIYTADEVTYGKSLRLYKEFLDHELADSYWKQIEITPEDFQKISIPTLSFTGWFDDTLPGTILNYQSIRRYSPSPEKHFLFIGPWVHLNSVDGGYNFITGEPVLSVGDIPLPEYASIPGLNLTTAFYNWCLKDEPVPPFESQVMVYLTGSHQWLHLQDYPPAETEIRSFFLSSSGKANSIHGDGRLISAPPGDEPTDEIIHNPLEPFKQYVKTDGVYEMKIEYLPIDISSFLDRNDTLVFLSEPLEQNMTVLGQVQLELYASTDALDADFHAILEDVSPDGSAIKLGPRDAGLARARFINGFEQETPVEPGVPFKLSISLYDIGHTFLPGHKLRLSIMCSMYPSFFPNPGTGGSIAQNVDPPRVARNRVFHDSLQASALHVPVYTLQ